MKERIIRSVYNRIVRPWMPRTRGVFADVPVPIAPTDKACPRITDRRQVQPRYKLNLIREIRSRVCRVQPLENVGVVGGGRGVTSVHAARCGGQITAYEAAGEMVEVARKTARWQGLEHKIDVVHGIVSVEGGEVYGTDLGDPIPTEGLDHQTVVMDCEGAEMSIIPELDEKTKTVIVETHPKYGATDAEVMDRLEDSGYEIDATRPLSPRKEHKSVIVGVRS